MRPMRSMFHQHRRSVPSLNVASMPDLIFTVLFFFMIVTHMRDVDLKVKYQVPQGNEVEKVEHKSSVTYIYIGRSKTPDAKDGQTFYIQLNNKLATLDDIQTFIEKETESMSEEDRTRMTVSIKADKDVPMGIIADVKERLQQSFALKINYSATEK